MFFTGTPNFFYGKNTMVSVFFLNFFLRKTNPTEKWRKIHIFCLCENVKDQLFGSKTFERVKFFGGTCGEIQFCWGKSAKILLIFL